MKKIQTNKRTTSDKLTRMATCMILLAIGTILAITSISCGDFLDGKSDKKLAIPVSVGDFQAILESPTILSSEPMFGELSSDDYYVSEADWSALASEFERRGYIWEPDYLFGAGLNDWTAFSNAIYVANTVIEGLQEMQDKSHPEYTHVLAQGYYIRGRKMLQASFLWCGAYNAHTAAQMLGMPLRVGTDFNETSVRSSLQQTYEQLIGDLKRSVDGLPARAINVLRPSKAGAYGTLARAYLYMGDYPQAYAYADSCLQINASLLDFNTLNAGSPRPVPPANVEIIAENGFTTGQILGIARMRVDSVLYSSYDENDLRRSILFQRNADGTHSFKGTMMQAGTSCFSGITSGEMYLVRAEAALRMGNIEQAESDINTLRKARFRNGSFQSITLGSREDALAFVLRERRKELVFRGLRWTDIKRLNLQGYNITLSRALGVDQYELEPNDLRYALPIPEDVIEMSGMQQNPR